MSGNGDNNAKRRLDLGNTANANAGRTIAKNPYIKAQDLAEASKTKVVVHTVKKDPAALENLLDTLKGAPAGEGGGPPAAASTAVVTPDAGIEKFLVPARRKAGDAKPRAARKLVAPREDDARRMDDGLEARNSLDFSSEDDTDGLYYHSDTESRTSNVKKKSKIHGADHIHSSLDYHHRGDLPLGQGTLKAYRFIRKNFLVPHDIESDPKFGAHSGTCFEERVIRAYSLGQLKPKKPNQSGGSLLVCSYCGDEGHKRDGCSKLL